MPLDLDATDWAILREVQADARLSFNQLAKRVNLSAPSVAARVKRLEEAGVITGYHARVAAPAAGLPLAAFVQLHCRVGRCLLRTGSAAKFPEIEEIHRLSGDSCSMIKVRTGSVGHLSSFLERIGEHADANSHIVLETPYDRRPVEPAPELHPPTLHSGWPSH